ncbi:MAG: acetate/propionate family kinase [Rhizobiales bacterium]|nr:acetate/propionate family kinase [Hyphomicrobiales bacterium]
MRDAILALNAGSSSVKFGLYDIEDVDDLRLVARGTLDEGGAPRFVVKAPDGEILRDVPVAGDGATAPVRTLVRWIEEKQHERKLVACGHRIVHGGGEFADPVGLTPPVMSALDKLTPLAPLHQPLSLSPVRTLTGLRPDLLQVGCFDTAFHRTIEPLVSRYALPPEYAGKGIRRYGFHGLSYEYVAGRLADGGKKDKRTIVAHLGNGASLCAIKEGRSIDTTMGFSALDGLMMGTRCGSIDPGVLLYLLLEQHMSAEEVQHLLYEEAGLLGVSGISGDMRELEASADPRARLAIDMFAFRASREVAALANTLGDLDCLVFTAGIGEHSAAVRGSICRHLGWLGLTIDEVANSMHAGIISAPDTQVEVLVIPTDEEVMIAHHTLNLMRSA